MAAAIHPSGPKGQFFLGHLAEYKRDTLGFVTRCAREYGDIVPLRLGHKPLLLLNHPDHIVHVSHFLSALFSGSRASLDGFPSDVNW